MGRFKATKLKQTPHATELRQLKDELRRVAEKLASREGELAKTLEQQAITSEILRAIANSPTNFNRCTTSRVGGHGVE